MTEVSPYMTGVKKLLLRIIIVSLIGFFIIWKFTPHILSWLLDISKLQIMTITPFESLCTRIYVCGYVEALILFPYILYEIYNFISSGLYTSEKRIIQQICAPLYISYILGATIPAYWFFKLTMLTLTNYAIIGVSESVSLLSYILLVIMMSIVGGIIFCMPVMVGYMTIIGILKPSAMQQYRKHSIVMSAVFSAVVTPTTDVFCMLVLMVPIVILYEVSIVISKIVEGRKRK